VSAFGIVKATIGPASIPFLVLCTVIGLLVIYVWPKRRALGRAWLTAVYASYLVLGVPVVAQAIAGSLSAYRPLTDRSALDGIQSLIVLDGDNRRGRADEALKIWAAASPGQVVVSGEEWLIDKLTEAGVPRQRIRHESAAQNTREQIDWMKGFLAGQSSSAVIASRLQMPRVAALARASALTPALAPSPVDVEPPTTGAWRFVPSYFALRLSRDAIYEHAALVYYEWRGWISQE
jgi:hypothetical protein